MIKNGKIWPVMIAAGIFGVVVLSYWTIKETARSDLTQSNLYMSNYQNVDDSINEILGKQIAFNKHYRITLYAIDLSGKEGFVRYRLEDAQGQPVVNAKMELVLSRPVSDASDITMHPSKVQNGIYSFEGIALPKVGRWDLLLKVEVGEYMRYYNLKADTRSTQAFEF